MKKLMLLAAMLAMVLVAAAPALAQNVSSGDIFQECVIEFGDQNVGAAVEQANEQDQSNVQNAEDNVAAAESGDAGAIAAQAQDVGAIQGGLVVNADLLSNILVDLNGDGEINDEDVALVLNAVDANQEGTADAASGDANAAAGNQYSDQDQNAANVTNITQNVTQEQIAFCEQIAESVAEGEVAYEEALKVIKEEAADKAAADKHAAADEYHAAADEYHAPADKHAAADEYHAPAEKHEGVAMLPDTGGASLLTLGVGALLVAGGLLARRMFR
ncbi:MAG: hypothetical protein ACFB50_00320 [Rubrobacteraceae bacterium]